MLDSDAIDVIFLSNTVEIFADTSRKNQNTDGRWYTYPMISVANSSLDIPANTL